MNRTPVMKTNWFGLSPYLIKDQKGNPQPIKKSNSTKQKPVSTFNEDDIIDFGDLPEVIITPQNVIKESPIVAWEDPYQKSDRAYEEDVIPTHWEATEEGLSHHYSSPEAIQQVIITGGKYPQFKQNRNHPLEIIENAEPLPMAFNSTPMPNAHKELNQQDIAQLISKLQQIYANR